ncbi:hypothetical protein ATANTOWER_010220 [Ataeniobius toweri]|uniref:Uncharacterized protein n=1 Tax=Ataeniobius toweri TaxID=208326 RepID=A0ABU7C5N8_9TELE|nr:hypothetical protein [Ataeniobius toweri]
MLNEMHTQPSEINQLRTRKIKFKKCTFLLKISKNQMESTHPPCFFYCTASSLAEKKRRRKGNDWKEELELKGEEEEEKEREDRLWQMGKNTSAEKARREEGS